MKITVTIQEDDGRVETLIVPHAVNFHSEDTNEWGDIESYRRNLTSLKPRKQERSRDFVLKFTAVPEDDDYGRGIFAVVQVDTPCKTCGLTRLEHVEGRVGEFHD
jgi:hypothetical protein